MNTIVKKTINILAVVAIAFVALILPQSVVLAKKNPFIPYKTPKIILLQNINIQTTTFPMFPWEGTIIYNGYGTVNWDTKLEQLTMTPKAATQTNETHAALVISKTSYQQPFQLSYTMKTTKQLRIGSTPNPWEVGWVVFGYKNDGKFKYLTLKPNGYGLELGESLLNDRQNFLYTSTLNKDFFPINKDYNVIINAQNNNITITINDKQYAQYSITNKDVLTVDGKYGFYTEDASVQVSNIKMEQL